MGVSARCWLSVGIGCLVLVTACVGGASAPPTPTPVPTVVQIPTVPRPPLDTPTVQGTPTPSTSVIHVVQAGETLGQIALRYYGDANRWQRIYDANRAQIPDPNALTIGTRLNIPPP
jgi:nucleoid-associated protein YgaU